MICTSSLFGTN
jgi:hypothetical protein